jgi:hypothetical protein
VSVVLGARPLEADEAVAEVEADPPASDAPERLIRLPMVALAALFSGSSAAWLAGGLIRGAMLPRALALLGVVIGVGLVFLSFRLAKPAVLQYLVVPVAALAGGIAIAPVATGGSANLPGLVAEAVRSGGLLQPPVPFNPGWRFILVVVFALVGAASMALAAGTNRAKVAVAVPLPMTLGAALLQPKGNEIVASTVGIFLVIGSLAVAFGAEVAPDAVDTRSFETKRLLRGAGLLVLLMALIVGLAQTDVLFPASNQEKVIPPRRPPPVPPERDRELFLVKSERPGPWRVGVLDVYDGQGWLLPPADAKRVHTLTGPGVPPATDADFSDADGTAPPAAAATAADPAGGTETERAVFNLVDMSGRSLPVPAGLRALEGTRSKVEYDPRLGVPRLPARVPRGYTYTAVAARLPKGSALNAAPPPAAAVTAAYASVPSMPSEVATLLGEAPAKPFDRLQFLRDRLYQNVTAAGGGQPKDVPPARVAAMLQPGAEATPFEITAAEALLARWSGVPARIGFGYHGGDKVEGGYSLRPKHGAAWLEVWFTGYGWVPLVGTPPQAKSSLSKDQKNDDPKVKPSQELAVQVLIPIQRRGVKQLFEIVRYWVLTVLPFAVLTLLVWTAVPALCKALRTRRRRRWAAARGPAARILAAYTGLRDQCHDLNVGDSSQSPLGFTRAFTADDEHTELAWAVTRALWGDLRRDLRDGDAAETEALVSSVRRRIAQAQPVSNRIVGAVARASLRDPWSVQVPNVWPQVHLGRRLLPVQRLGAAALSRVRSRRRPAAASTAAVALLAVLLLAGCVHQGGLGGSPVPTAYPARIAPEPPATLLSYELVRSAEAEVEYAKAQGDALVTEGRVFAIRDGEEIQGTLQVALFRKELNATKARVQKQVMAAIGGRFTPYWVGSAKLYVRRLPDQDLYVWFPPERNVLVSFYMRKSFAAAADVVDAVVAYQRGIDPAQVPTVAARRTSLGLPPVTAVAPTTSTTRQAP